LEGGPLGTGAHLTMRKRPLCGLTLDGVMGCCDLDFAHYGKVCIDSVYADSSGMVMVPVGEVLEFLSLHLPSLSLCVHRSLKP
jgi:hypothetical protein